jgi:hypothetical protein
MEVSESVEVHLDHLDGAPEALSVFVGRDREFGFLNEAWRDGSLRILTVTGPSGQGKTSLVREWVRRVSRRQDGGGFASVFWWTIDPDRPDVDQLLGAIIRNLSMGRLDPASIPSTEGRANLAAYLMSTGRHLLVLDGAEACQSLAMDLEGSIVSIGLLDFLRYLAAPGGNSVTVLTSRLTFPELEPISTYRELPLGALPDEEAVHLLAANGIYGSAAQLKSAAHCWGNHALALATLAVVLKRDHGGRAEQVWELPISDELPATARLRALGNLVERGRSDYEVRLLRVLALVRTPISPEVLADVTSAIAGASEKYSAAIRHFVRTNMCRSDAAGRVMLHPTLANLYSAQVRLMAPSDLRVVHRTLAQYYFEQLA